MSGMVHDGWYIMMDLDGYFDDNLQDEDVGFRKKGCQILIPWVEKG